MKVALIYKKVSLLEISAIIFTFQYISIKNRLRGRIGDQWMNDCLVTYIEKKTFDTIGNEKIMQRF